MAQNAKIECPTKIPVSTTDIKISFCIWLRKCVYNGIKDAVELLFSSVQDFFGNRKRFMRVECALTST